MQRSVLFPILRRSWIVVMFLTAMLAITVATAISGVVEEAVSSTTLPSPVELRCETVEPCIGDSALRRSARRTDAVDLSDLGEVATLSVVHVGGRPAPSVVALRNSVLDLANFDVGTYRIYAVLSSGEAFEVLLSVLP